MTLKFVIQFSEFRTTLLSWLMVRFALILVGLAFLGTDLHAAPPGNAFKIECQHPGDLTETTTDGKTSLSIQGRGISRAVVTPDPHKWPKDLVLRIHLQGLESLAIDNGEVQWSASVSSHQGHPTRLHVTMDGGESTPLTKDSPFWTEIRRFKPDLKPATGLPPKGGWFELTIPRALLEGERKLKFTWIDFYR